jgi:Glycolipid 2-alpha-mannosyltransferase
MRNRELRDALRSMRQIEDRFNHQFHYSWVFLNDEPFTQEFRLLTAGMASGTVEYGLIDKNEWSTPAWIDTEKAQQSMEEMVRKDVIYGGSVSYRYPFPSETLTQTYVSIQFRFLLATSTVDEICVVLARGTRYRLLV